MENSNRLLQIQFGLLALLLALHLFGWSAGVNICLLLLLISVFFLPNKKQRFTTLFSNKWFIISVLPFLVYAVSLLFTQDSTEGVRNVTTKLPLLLFPFIFGMLQDSFTPQKQWQLAKIFLLSVAAMGVVGFIAQYGMYKSTGSSEYFYNDHLGSIFGKQAVYFAWFVNSALCILLFGNKKLSLEWNAGVRIFLFAVLVGTQILLASRTSLGIMSLLVGIYAVQLIFRGFSKVKLLLTGALTAALIVAVVFLFPKVLNRFQGITQVEYRLDNPNPLNHFNGTYSADNWDGLTVRLAIWECTWYTINKQIWTGCGVGDIPAELRKSYKEKNFLLGTKEDFNTHNQFLDSWLAAGIAGFLIFSLSLIALTVNLVRRGPIIIAMLFVTLLLSMLTENILNRNQGVMLAGLLIGIQFVCLTYKSSQAKDKSGI